MKNCGYLISYFAIAFCFLAGPPASGATLVATPAALVFDFQTGSGTNPAAQQLSIASSGDPLNFTASSSAAWISADKNNGATPSILKISVTPGSLPVGTYHAMLTFAAAGDSESVLVTLVVRAAPTFQVTPASLTFNSQFNFGGVQPRPLYISGNTTPYTVSFRTITGGQWMSVGYHTGISPDVVYVSAAPADSFPETISLRSTSRRSTAPTSRSPCNSMSSPEVN